MEAKQFEDEGLLVGGFFLLELGRAGCIFFRLLLKVLDPGVGPDAGGADLGDQHDTFEAFAAAQRHIDLPVGKCCLCVQDHPLEGQALAFVDGDGPGQP